jgi:hypothetical protein
VGDPVKPPEITGPRSYPVPRGSQPWPELITGPSKKAVLREVARSLEAGELAASGPLEHVGGGRYQVAVWRIRERRVERRWVRPVAIASGAVTALSGLAAAGWWMAGMAATALSVVSVPLLVGILASAVLMWLALRRGNPPAGGGGCETTVTIHHRHH